MNNSVNDGIIKSYDRSNIVIGRTLEWIGPKTDSRGIPRTLCMGHCMITCTLGYCDSCLV